MIEKVSEKKTHKISDWNHVIYAKIHDYILNEPGDKKKTKCHVFNVVILSIKFGQHTH